MSAPQRRPVPGVIARLATEPWRFEFMQALRLLLVWLRRSGIRPERALRDILRFENSLSLGFPASEIASLHIEGDAGVTKIRLTPAFIGLLGANGTLPLHYTERIAAHEHAQQDASARAFVDLLSDRVVSLFFRAWGTYRHELTIDLHGEDRFRPMLLALGARQSGAARAESDQSVLQADVLAFYAGLLRQRPISAAALRCILADYFGVPIAIEQFTGGWDEIADRHQCRMGAANAMLGHGGTLGVRTWRHDLRITLHLGPLGKADYERFLPGGASARALEAMLGTVGIAGLQYLAHVMLRPEDVAPLELVGGAKPGKRTGWDTRLGLGGEPRPVDVRYLLRPS